jgi:hypothetical protein
MCASILNKIANAEYTQKFKKQIRNKWKKIMSQHRNWDLTEMNKKAKANLYVFFSNSKSHTHTHRTMIPLHWNDNFSPYRFFEIKKEQILTCFFFLYHRLNINHQVYLEMINTSYIQSIAFILCTCCVMRWLK